MEKYEDFDLDMKVTSGSDEEPMGRTTIATTTFSVVVCVSASCMICISEKNCTKGICSGNCQTPTKNRPAPSCHLKNGNPVQMRC